MDIRDFITKEDLGEPYAWLAECLDLSDILKLEKEFHGRQIRFNKQIIDISTEQRELVIIMGKAKATQISKILSGGYIYFPSIAKSCRHKIKRLIIQEFNGYNTQELSKKFGYSERYIKNIIDRKSQKTRKQIDGQMWLDEFIR